MNGLISSDSRKELKNTTIEDFKEFDERNKNSYVSGDNTRRVLDALNNKKEPEPKNIDETWALQKSLEESKPHDIVEMPVPEKLRDNQLVTVPSLKLGKPSKSGVSQGTLSISEEYKLEKERQKESEETDKNDIKETEVEEFKTTDGSGIEIPDKSYAELCKQCVIRDIVGCDHCGVFVYGYHHKQFKISVEKIQ